MGSYGNEQRTTCRVCAETRGTTMLPIVTLRSRPRLLGSSELHVALRECSGGLRTTLDDTVKSSSLFSLVKPLDLETRWLLDALLVTANIYQTSSLYSKSIGSYKCYYTVDPCWVHTQSGCVGNRQEKVQGFIPVRFCWVDYWEKFLQWGDPVVILVLVCKLYQHGWSVWWGEASTFINITEMSEVGLQLMTIFIVD